MPTPSHTAKRDEWNPMTPDGKMEEYARLGRKYLAEAEDLLKKQDYTQASEKLWGAAAEAVKAVAAKRGISLGTHRSLSEFISRLETERPESRLADLWHVANSLHTNFYEDHLAASQVQSGAQRVRELIEDLRSF